MMLDIAETKSLYVSICDIEMTEIHVLKIIARETLNEIYFFLFKENNLHDKRLSVGVTLWTAEPIQNSFEYIEISPFFTMAEKDYYVSHFIWLWVVHHSSSVLLTPFYRQ